MKLKARVRKITAKTYGITIPKQLIKSGILNEGKEYSWIANELRKKN